MSTVIDTAYLNEQVTIAKAKITAYQQAIDDVVCGAQSYTLDTGQTRQTVTKATLKQLQDGYAYWWNVLESLNARLCGGSHIYSTPNW